MLSVFQKKLVAATAIASCVTIGASVLPATMASAAPSPTPSTAANVPVAGATPGATPTVTPTASATAARPPASQPAAPGPVAPPKPNPVAPEPRYSFNGVGNNLLHTDWGSVKVAFLRVAPAAYGDGKSTMGGATRPSARAVSNAIDAQSSSMPNNRRLTDMVYVFGQFLDHDITRTIATTGDSKPIAVPKGDPQFDPTSTGTAKIPFTRSTFAGNAGSPGVRQQNNWVTSFIDGSQVYGSDGDRAKALRTLSGGLLKTSTGNMMPFNTTGLANDNDAHQVADTQLFLAGDVRANENPGLISIHTLFVREHNRLATALAAANPRLDDDQLYQKTRRIVIAELQWIVYNEYLPALLGSNAMPRYAGYNANVNPGIANEFATAAYRYGHSMLDGEVGRLNDDGTEVAAGGLELATSFFNPTVFDTSLPQHSGDIDPFLKSESTGIAQEVDVYVDDAVRNFLFGPPGAGGLDLAALNIQRGRDHGLADYNTMRAAYGLPRVTTFNQITSDTTLATKLRTTYGTVNNIDAWVGGLAETHVSGGSLGPLFTKIIADQFTRLRTGDRLYFENVLDAGDIAKVKSTSLSSIIKANTSLTTVQANVFVAP